MAFCTKCGAAYEPGKNFCTGCGNPLSVASVAVEPTVTSIAVTPSCKSCGAPLAEGQSFCIKCGASQKTDASPPSIQVQAPVTKTVEVQSAAKLAEIVAPKITPLPPPRPVEFNQPQAKLAVAPVAPTAASRPVIEPVVIAPVKPQATSSDTTPVPVIPPPPPPDFNSDPVWETDAGTTKPRLIAILGVVVALAAASAGGYLWLSGSAKTTPIAVAPAILAATPSAPNTPAAVNAPAPAPVPNVEPKPDIAPVAPPAQPAPAAVAVPANNANPVTKPAHSRSAPSVKATKQTHVQAHSPQAAVAVTSEPIKRRCRDVVPKVAGFLHSTCDTVGVDAFITCTNGDGRVFDNCKKIGSKTCGELAGLTCSNQF